MDKNFTSRFEMVVKKLGKNIKQVSDAIDMSHTGLTNILNGISIPKISVIYSLLELDQSINADWLITGRGNMYINETQTPPSPVEEPSQVYESKKTNTEMDLMKEVNYLSKQVKQLEQIVELQNEKIKTLATELDTYRADGRKKNAS